MNLILTAYQNDGVWSEIGDLTSARNGVAAEVMGCRMLVRHDFYMGRPKPWSKIIFLRDALRDYERVMWIDADAYIMRPFDYMSLAGLGDLVVAKDWQTLNCGVMWWKRSDWTFTALDRMWDMTEYADKYYWDRFVIRELTNDGYFENNAWWVASQVYNSYQRTNLACILHAVGIGEPEKKLEFLQHE